MVTPEVPLPQAGSPRAARRVFRRLVHRPGAAIAIFLLASFLVLAIAAPHVSPRSPAQQELDARLIPPGGMSRLGGHWLGTDHLGRDILARVIYGTRVSLLVGTGAVVLGATVGILLGSIAGFGGGWRDSVIMRIVDVQLAIPMVLVAIGWAAFVRPSLMSVTIMIALWGWAKYARVSRGAVLVLREQEFVLAAAALGATRTRLIIRHVLPNLLPIVLVLATLEVGRAILLESTLSFLGLGLQPPTVSWGVMLDDAKDYLEVAWWGAVFPGLAISLFVLSANLLGDALRDALDPRLRRSGI